MEKVEGSEAPPENRGKGTNFKCDQCEFSSIEPITLQMHEKEAHSVKRAFKCSYCDYTATTCAKLKIHRKVHGVPGSKQFKCSKCPAQFTNGDNLKDHFNSHTGQKPYKCKFCHFRASYRPSLAVHMLMHDPSKQLSCSQCEYVTHVRLKLKRHVIVHHSEAPFIHCTESGCKYKTKDKIYLTTHVNAVHRKDVHYRCKLCAKGFYDKSSFENHFRTHTGERTFKCDLCSYSSGKKTTLKTHQKVHSTAHNVQCPTCGKVLRDKNALKGHQKVHSESRQFPCSMCPYRLTTETSLQQHVTNKHKDNNSTKSKSSKKKRPIPYIKVRIRNVVKKIKSYQCTFCDFHTNSLSSFNSHVRGHTGEKPFKCDQCDYASVQVGNLARHKRQKHMKAELPTLPCKYCEFRTKSKDSLTLHEKRHFPEASKVYKCNQCSFASDNGGNLKVHLRTHSGERPFPCSICSYRGPTKYCLESHLAGHSEAKPFECPSCDFRARTVSRMRQHKSSRHGIRRKNTFFCSYGECTSSYKVASQLRDHIRAKHKKETRFKCPQCPAAFFQRYRLTCHLRTHTGEKPYKCDLCSYTGATSSSVSEHKRRVHFPSRDFCCSECDWKFKSKGKLARHMEVHSLKRRYACPFCTYRATTKRIANLHCAKCPRKKNMPLKGPKLLANEFSGSSMKTVDTEESLFKKFGCTQCFVKLKRLRIIE